jgi:hypothetical protein
MGITEKVRGYNKAYYQKNRERLKEYMRIYYKQYRTIHPERIKRAHRKYNSSNPEKVAAAKRKYKYGLSPEGYDALMKQQGSACAICKTPNWADYPPHVDHDHKSGRVRGILCRCCNVAIGLIKDNPKTARTLADYLERNATVE